MPQPIPQPFHFVNSVDIESPIPVPFQGLKEAFDNLAECFFYKTNGDGRSELLPNRELLGLSLPEVSALIDRADSLPVGQVRLFAEHLQKLGAELKTRLADPYNELGQMSDYLRATIPFLKDTQSASESLEHRNEKFKMDAIACIDSAKTAVDTSKELSSLKEAKKGVSEIDTSFGVARLSGSQKLINKFFGRYAKKATPLVADKIDKEAELEDQLRSANQSYSSTAIRMFVLTGAHKEENIKLIQEYFTAVNPLAPDCPFAMRTQVGLLIEAIESIGIRRGITMLPSEPFNKYVKKLVKLGSQRLKAWHEKDPKDAAAIKQLARRLSAASAHIELEQRVSRTISTLSSLDLTSQPKQLAH